MPKSGCSTKPKALDHFIVVDFKHREFLPSASCHFVAFFLHLHILTTGLHLHHFLSSTVFDTTYFSVQTFIKIVADWIFHSSSPGGKFVVSCQKKTLTAWDNDNDNDNNNLAHQPTFRSFRSLLRAK